MAIRYIPLALKHSPTPKVEHFAILAALDGTVRSGVISVMPLLLYEVLGSASVTSLVYLASGIVSLVWGLLVPWLTTIIPRRWTYTLGGGLYVLGAMLGVLLTPLTAMLALLCFSMATATVYVCLQAYVLDYVERAQLGRSQSLQLFYAAIPWMVGPMGGVWMWSIWRPLPFVFAACAALMLMTVFWILRLGNGRQIQRAKAPAVNPLGYLGKFLHQPRLVVGWCFAVIRSTGWWVFIVYLPIFCVEAGLGDRIAGTAYSLANGFLFLAPWINSYSKRHSLRVVLRLALAAAGVLLVGAALLSIWPLMTVLFVFCASFFFLVLDVVGGLPFLMAVRPAERTEMSAVYASFRDVSGILAPALAWGVLLVAPLPGIFAVTGLGFLGAWGLARNLHPRLGVTRPSRARP